MMGEIDPVIADVVRSFDRDRYICALHAPPAIRGDLLALYAFHAEITRVADLASEPMPGEIRLQWWRDALVAESGVSQKTGNPVAQTVAETIARHGLPRKSFDDMIEARTFDLYADPMATRRDLEGYCGETASALFQLAALIADKDRSASVAELAGHGGCAFEITRLLDRFSLHKRRGQCYVPEELLAAVGTDLKSFTEHEPGEEHSRAIAAMVALARDHYQAFLDRASDMDAAFGPVFLPMAVVAARLQRIERAGLDLLKRPFPVSPLRRQASFFYRSIRGWR